MGDPAQGLPGLKYSCGLFVPAVPSWYHHRRPLLASLSGCERGGGKHSGSRPRAVAPSSRRTSSPARIPDWEREEGKLRAWLPASCRRPVIFGGRRLLLASLTGSERRGDSVHGARPRAVAPSSSADIVSCSHP